MNNQEYIESELQYHIDNIEMCGHTMKTVDALALLKDLQQQFEQYIESQQKEQE